MDNFEEYLKSYGILFDATGSLTALIFGGASFIIVRSLGIISDKGIQ